MSNASTVDKCRDWSLMTKTKGGVVSILRDLSLSECRQAYKRLNPDYGITKTYYKQHAGSNALAVTEQDFSFGGMEVHDNRIEMREVFGPPGWDRSEIVTWDEWPKSIIIEWDDERHFRFKKGDK